MNVDLDRSDIHTLIRACEDRRTVLHSSFPVPAEQASVMAITLASLKRAEQKLRDAIAPGEDVAPHETDGPHYEREGPQS